MTKHSASYRRGADGRVLVHVALSNSDRCAILDQADYEAVIAKIGLTSWYLNGAKGFQYVRAHEKGGKRFVTISRVILDSPYRAAVKHLDGDRLNLRIDNLYLDFGGGGVQKRRAVSGT
jgi:hypothetical protein